MKFNSIYIPPEGKYTPTPIKDASSYGYPWQHNPLRHKVISEPYRCQRRNVFRIYQDNSVFYTRTPQQVADGLHSYYLYDDQGRITETGEVTLPIQFTDDNWYQYPYRTYGQQAAFIRSLGGRTNVMVATYQELQVTSAGGSLCFHPLKSIRGYALIAAGTPMDAEGYSLTPDSSTHHNFIFNGKEDVDVSIYVHHHPVAASPRATLQPAQQADTSAANMPIEAGIAIHHEKCKKEKVIQEDKPNKPGKDLHKQESAQTFLIRGLSNVAAAWHQRPAPTPHFHITQNAFLFTALINRVVFSDTIKTLINKLLVTPVTGYGNSPPVIAIHPP